jgi:hypothetical protein
MCEINWGLYARLERSRDENGRHLLSQNCTGLQAEGKPWSWESKEEMAGPNLMKTERTKMGHLLVVHDDYDDLSLPLHVLHVQPITYKTN